MFYKTDYDSPIGTIVMVTDGINLCELSFKGPAYYLETKDNFEIFKKTKNWLDRYFKRENPAISELLIAPEGSNFRQTVWQILCKIPYGTTITYGEIAKKISKNMAAQAIGGAVGHNPLSIIIPCHRVVGVKGSLTGYASGLEIKVKLLELEGVDMSKFFIP